jgi:DNA-binding transcriptional LysR family regulator
LLARHFPYFIAAAEEGNFQRAADRLNIAQSALSRRIQDLEAELGVPLFQRQARGVRLTTAGQAFLADVRKVMDDIDEAAHHAARVMRGQEGELNIGFVEVVPRFAVLTDAFQAFRVAYPRVQLQLRPMITDFQVERMHAGEIDAGLMFHTDLTGEFERRELLRDRFLLALPRAHPLAERRDLRLEDLTSEDFIWSSRRLSRTLFDRMIAASRAGGLSPRIGTEVFSSDTTFNLVAIGMGIGFVPASQAGRQPENVALVRVLDFDLELPLELVWLKDRMSPSLAHFIATMTTAPEPH